MRRRRRKRINRPLWVLVTVLVIGGLSSAALCAYLQSSDSYPFLVVLRARLLDLLVVAWLFWIGSSVGSFLNVVAWRLPRGRSLGGRSHCPFCDAQLKGRDNVPVFGWIALRGRCRSCRLPISPRYPIGELTCGLMFVLFGFVELWRGGANLPYLDRANVTSDPVSIPQIDGYLVALVIYHATALANLFAFGLTRMNGKPVPVRWMLWSLAAAAIPALAFPPLRIIPWQLRLADRPPNGLLDALVYVICALAAAGILGRYLAGSLLPKANLKLQPLGGETARLVELMTAFSIVSVALGWQTLFGVALLCVLAALFVGRYLQQADALTLLLLCLAPATAAYLAGWRLFEAIPILPGANRNPMTAIGAAIVTWGLTLFLKPVQRAEPPPAHEPL